ncbi:MAG TPA: NlpC/P60 family N-terminal domain-containing protein, partial [Syntrophales bacterium]|nr:NlpC/P60 family N-terminal domain-containing protein [Syntrophales bacterium]
MLHNIRILLILLLFISACAGTPETIRDIRDLKQDNMFYIDKTASKRPLVDAVDQGRMDSNYNSLFFSPWHRKNAFYGAHAIESAFKKYSDNPGYGENRRRHEAGWIKELALNADLSKYPNASFAAITVDNSDLRVIPTHKPYFYDANTDRGYPFDRLQESSVAPNTPVFVTHVTRDKAWVLAETPYAAGWISARNIARVDGSFVEK